MSGPDAYPPLLHMPVARQAARLPDAPAVTAGARSLCYRQLDAAANALAYRLQALGVGTDVPVGLATERCLEMVVGILAVLKAGGAFAPLEPELSDERLDHLVSDLACPIILADAAGAARLAGRCAATVVPLDGCADAPGVAQAPPCPAHPASLAYVMYTSGTTGRPKGVLITHEGGLNFVRWIARRFPLPPDGTVLQWTPNGFDPSVWELFWPLLLGHRAVLAPPHAHVDMDAVAELIARENVATLHFTPPSLAAFLDARGVAACTGLRWLFCSGEPVPTALTRGAAARTRAPIVNLYGATEVSVDSTYFVCDPPPVGSHVPAGVALDNTVVHLLDDAQHPVAAGDIGEVYLSGDSVARGYLGMPGLTAQRFVPDPAGPPGSRMYRTGDMARILPSGDLFVLGRRDGQVKIRGVRIELAEIESVALEHPPVRSCAASVHGEGADRHVALYVVIREPLDEDGLRSLLRRRLPPAALPAAIVVLPELPVSATGKVDRTALPAPVIASEPTAPPRTPTEERIAEIWAALLGVPAVGVHDDFVLLGGDSLLAARVINRMQDELDVRIPLETWMSAGTVAELAVAVEEARAAGSELADMVAGMSEDEVRDLLARLDADH